ncbi:MAG: ABC transporter ATP-binding protein [Chloroflexi bacterium]|nr:ABC transporter ATP-binding protein [Chloroflexota bacterium]MCI0769193.1 ABC transporter ATP-binding protein [Chloroflexota bacterium]
MLLEVCDLDAGYGQTQVLHGVSIRVDEREIVTIIGPNGSGKSTLLKAITGVVRPTAGRVVFGSDSIAGLSPDRIVRKGISYVPQTENVFPSLTVQENLEMGAFLRRDLGRERLPRIYELFPDLVSKRRDRASRLSGGQRQMLALARALMLDPTLLLLDEPSAGLAPMMVDDVFDKIAEINQMGIAILIVEQKARRSLQQSHRGYVLATGQTRLEDTGERLLANPEVRRLYLGG